MEIRKSIKPGFGIRRERVEMKTRGQTVCAFERQHVGCLTLGSVVYCTTLTFKDLFENKHLLTFLILCACYHLQKSNKCKPQLTQFSGAKKMKVKPANCSLDSNLPSEFEMTKKGKKFPLIRKF
jgi:hypothetical protein